MLDFKFLSLAPKQNAVHNDALLPVKTVALCLPSPISYTEEGYFLPRDAGTPFVTFAMICYLLCMASMNEKVKKSSYQILDTFGDPTDVKMISVKVVLAVALQCGFTMRDLTGSGDSVRTSSSDLGV